MEDTDIKKVLKEARTTQSERLICVPHLMAVQGDSARTTQKSGGKKGT